MILDRDANYLAEFGGPGKDPGQFNGVHAVAVGPNGLIFALDRSGGRINVFRTTPDPKKVEFVAAWPGFSLPLDLIVNDDAVWMTDLKPLRFVKLDFDRQPALHLARAERSPGRLSRGARVLGGLSGQPLWRGQSVRANAEVRAEARRRSEAADSSALVTRRQ